MQRPNPLSNNSPPGASTAVNPAEQPRLNLSYHHTSRNGIVLSLVSFDDRDYKLKVADQTNGPGTHWLSAEAAAKAHHGVAAINGGFFTPEGSPLGQVVANGKKRGLINRSSLGSGFFWRTSHEAKIQRRELYQQKPAALVEDLLQTGPMLVDKRRAVSGLSKKSQRIRSFLAWDGQHHWAIGYADPCTLEALAQAIAGRAPGQFPIHMAVNLDGGRSSELWAGKQVANGNQRHRGWMNKAVRNYLVVVPQ